MIANEENIHIRQIIIIIESKQKAGLGSKLDSRLSKLLSLGSQKLRLRLRLRLRKGNCNGNGNVNVNGNDNL